MKPRKKIYNVFTDKYGNEYKFDNYMDFAKFWYSLPRNYQINSFPDFKKLQYAAMKPPKEKKNETHTMKRFFLYRKVAESPKTKKLINYKDGLGLNLEYLYITSIMAHSYDSAKKQFNMGKYHVLTDVPINAKYGF